MKKIKFLSLFVVFNLLLSVTVFFAAANDEDISKKYFFVFVKAEYCSNVNSIMEEIDSEYISEIRELTNPEDYSEDYTPMLLVTVNTEKEDSFLNAQQYFDNKEYVTEIRYEYNCVSPLTGDVDGDGNITASDARFVLRCAVGLEEYTEAELVSGDMNSDGKLSAEDARLILRYSVGLYD